MNIKTANRLQQLRKEKGYTQESLADALGISRQAVSKWERAEASPDTDNLICLAKLYGISLDELLDSSDIYEDIKEDQINEDDNLEENDNDKVHIGKDGIHVLSSDGDEVHINLKGINVKEKNGDSVNVGFDGIHINNEIYYNSKSKRIIEIVSGIASAASILVYLILGLLYNLWHPAWIVFLLFPIIPSIFECFLKKKITSFNYPLLVCSVYLYLGCVYNLWHPWWVLFVSIPVFYMIARPIEKIWLKDNIKINIK